jgi:hypothetical protein
MKTPQTQYRVLAAAFVAASSLSVSAQVYITEVAPWGSSATTDYAADWFEVTNAGTETVNLTGWKVDDSSATFGSAGALRGVTSLAPGQTVVFLEGASTPVNDANLTALFRTAWFGAAVPVGLTLGFYGGTGLGLSTGGDGVNLFNSAGVLQASVSFGANTAGSPFRSFDNTAQLNGVTISELSALGVNGAFLADSGASIGSPGVTAVPEPTEYAAAFGLASVAFALWRRRQA